MPEETFETPQPTSPPAESESHQSQEGEVIDIKRDRRLFEKKYLIAGAVIVFMATGLAAVSIWQKTRSTEITGEITDETQQPALLEEKVSQEGEPLPSTPIPSRETDKTATLKDLLKGRRRVEIDVTSKYLEDKPFLQSIKSARITGSNQRSWGFARLAHAEEENTSTVEVPKVIFQQISDEQATDIAKKFGFQGPPAKPEQDPRVLRWEESTKRLIIDTYSIDFNQYLEGEPAPPYAEAEETALDFLRAVDFLPLEYDIYNTFPQFGETSVFWSYLDKDSPYYQKLVKATSVGLVTKHNGIPISRGDISAKFYGEEINAFPQTDVWMGPEKGIVKVAIAKSLSTEPGQQFPLKSKEAALEDLRATGGVFMNAEYLETPRGGSYCYESKCGVRDATISSAKLVYYLPSGFALPSYEDEDKAPHHVGYMIPMWLFGGVGDMLRTSDGVETHLTKVRFIAGVYAITGKEGQSIFKIGSFNLEGTGEDSFKASFNFVFNVPKFYNIRSLNPRQGMDYTLFVLYPDNTYGEYRGVIYDADSREELTIPRRGVTGRISAVLYLTDFPEEISLKEIEL